MRTGAKPMCTKRWGSSLRNSTISSIKFLYPRELTGMPPLFCLPGKPCRDEQSLPSGSGSSTSSLWNLCSQCRSWGIPSSQQQNSGKPSHTNPEFLLPETPGAARLGSRHGMYTGIWYDTRGFPETEAVVEGKRVGWNCCSVGWNKGFRATRGRLGGSSNQGHFLFVTDEYGVPWSLVLWSMEIHSSSKAPVEGQQFSTQSSSLKRQGSNPQARNSIPHAACYFGLQAQALCAGWEDLRQKNKTRSSWRKTARALQAR